MLVAIAAVLLTVAVARSLFGAVLALLAAVVLAGVAGIAGPLEPLADLVVEFFSRPWE